MRPKTVRPTQQPQYFPDDAQGPSEFLQPIYGGAVRMLLDGGPYDLTKPPESFQAENGVPRRPKRVLLGYEGEFITEPDPTISSKATTGWLVRAMWRSGWSREHAEAALVNPMHEGGAYYRWRLLTDREPEAFMDYLWTETPLTDTTDYYTAQVKGWSWSVSWSEAVGGDEGWSEVDGLLGVSRGQGSKAVPAVGTALLPSPKTYPLDPAKLDSLHRWIKAHRLPQRDLLAQAPADIHIHPRRIMAHLDELEAKGRATHTRQRQPSGQTAKVWQAIEPETPQPNPIPQIDLQALLDI